MRAFLREGGFSAFTTTFEDLHGLAQLPGLAVQRLMADGYGFGAEGDWKTAALVRAVKVMASGLRGRHLLHGGLHLPPRPEGPEGARGPHARGLPVDRGGEALARGPPAGHRRQGRPRPPGLQRRPGPRPQRLAHRPRQPLPPDRQRGGRGGARRRRCPSCPPRARSGCRGRASRSRPRPGSTPAARTTPPSARPSPRSTSRTTPRWPASSSCSSTRRRPIRELKKELRWNEAYYHLARGL